MMSLLLFNKKTARKIKIKTEENEPNGIKNSTQTSFVATSTPFCEHPTNHIGSSFIKDGESSTLKWNSPNKEFVINNERS